MGCTFKIEVTVGRTAEDEARTLRGYVMFGDKGKIFSGTVNDSDVSKWYDGAVKNAVKKQLCGSRGDREVYGRYGVLNIRIYFSGDNFMRREVLGFLTKSQAGARALTELVNGSSEHNRIKAEGQLLEFEDEKAVLEGRIRSKTPATIRFMKMKQEETEEAERMFNHMSLNSSETLQSLWCDNKYRPLEGKEAYAEDDRD